MMTITKQTKEDYHQKENRSAFFSFFKKQKWLSAVVALVFLLNTCSPAWARPGNYGETSSFESWGNGALAGFATSAACVIAGPNAPYVAVGSAVSDITNLVLYNTMYHSYGEEMFNIFGISVSKGEFWSMFAGTVATLLAGTIQSALDSSTDAAPDIDAPNASVEPSANPAPAVDTPAVEPTPVQEIPGGQINPPATLAPVVVPPAPIVAPTFWESLAGFFTDVWSIIKSIPVAGDIIGYVVEDLIYEPLKDIYELITDPAGKWAEIEASWGTPSSNPYYTYAKTGNWLMMIPQFCSDLALGTAKLITYKGVKGWLEKKFHTDETIAIILANAAADYVGMYLTVPFLSAFGWFFEDFTGLVTDKNDTEGKDEYLDTFTGVGGYLTPEHKEMLRNAKDLKVKIHKADGSEREISVEELISMGPINKNDLEFIKGADDKLKAYVHLKGELLDLNEVNGALIKYQQDLIALQAVLAMTGGGEMVDIHGNSISDDNVFQAGGKMVLKELGIRHLLSAGITAGVLTVLKYKTAIPGSDNDEIFRAAAKMAVARAIGGFVTDALSNWNAINRFNLWTLGVEDAELPGLREELNKKTQAIDELAQDLEKNPRFLTKGEIYKIGEQLQNIEELQQKIQDKEDKDVHKDPFRTAGTGSVGVYLFKRLSFEAMNVGSQLAWALYCRNNNIKQPDAMDELLHLAGSSLVTGATSALFRYDSGTAKEDVYVFRDKDDQEYAYKRAEALEKISSGELKDYTFVGTRPEVTGTDENYSKHYASDKGALRIYMEATQEDVIHTLTQAAIDTVPLGYSYRHPGMGQGAIQARWQEQDKMVRLFQSVGRGSTPIQAEASALANNIGGWADYKAANALSAGFSNIFVDPDYRSYAAFVTTEMRSKKLAEEKEKEITGLKKLLTDFDADKLKEQEDKVAGLLQQKRAEKDEGRIKVIDDALKEAQQELAPMAEQRDTILRIYSNLHPEKQGMYFLDNQDAHKIVSQTMLVEVKPYIERKINELEAQAHFLTNRPAIFGLVPIGQALNNVWSAFGRGEGTVDLNDIIAGGIVDYSVRRRVVSSPVDISKQGKDSDVYWQVIEGLTRLDKNKTAAEQEKDRKIIKYARDHGMSSGIESTYYPSVAGAPQDYETYSNAYPLFDVTGNIRGILKEGDRAAIATRLIDDIPGLSNPVPGNLFFSLLARSMYQKKLEDAVDVLARDGVQVFIDEPTLSQRTKVNRFGQLIRTEYYKPLINIDTNQVSAQKIDRATDYYYNQYGLALSVTKDRQYMHLPGVWPGKEIVTREGRPGSIVKTKNLEPVIELLKTYYTYVDAHGGKGPGKKQLAKMALDVANKYQGQLEVVQTKDIPTVSGEARKNVEAANDNLWQEKTRRSDKEVWSKVQDYYLPEWAEIFESVRGRKPLNKKELYDFMTIG
ncbi:MAG: hypothetical protein PHF11_02145, partial [Candidatus Omnitrophica bacterium]|nr:hypothetical protein [Candidatus Omnitrophota bacterium]